MNNKMAISAVMTICMAMAGSAFAKGHDHHDNHGHDAHTQSDHRNNEGRGAEPQHDLRRGAHLPSRYHSRHYVVNNWRGHHLSAPPRGYHWVQTGGDYVLVSISNGVILNVFLN